MFTPFADATVNELADVLVLILIALGIVAVLVWLTGYRR